METSTIRGFGVLTTALTRDEKKKINEVEYRNHKFQLPSSIRILILDSEGHLSQFNYYDTRYARLEQSLLKDPVSLTYLGAMPITPTIFLDFRDLEHFNNHHRSGGQMNSQGIQEEDGLTLPNGNRRLLIEEDLPGNTNSMGMMSSNNCKKKKN